MLVLVQSVAKDNLPPEQKSKADFQDVFINSAGKTEWKNLYELFSPCQESTLTLPLRHSDVSSTPVQNSNQGHPMDLFPKISVLQTKFSWLGNLEKLICPWKESVAEQYTIQGVRGDLLYTIACIFYFFISPSPIEGVNVSLRPHPIAYGPPPAIEGLNFAPMTTPKLGSNV